MGGEAATRVAAAADLDGLTTTLTLAFERDPLWRWAFPEEGTLEPFWRFYIDSVLRYPCTWISGDYAAAAVWVPPGGSELSDAAEERVEPLLRRLIGARAADVMELLDRFEQVHPREQSHYYLSLLGTHPAQRGRGVGMALLAHNLALIDREGAAAYLESSNPANDSRYERAGFRAVGRFETPDGAHTVTTMWRDARPAAA
jgi:GNAT superfamily N-acetyltransferase